MKPKILIVDDEPMTRNAMARALSRQYECLLAPDAEAAMAMLKATGDIALVITDYKMPGANGIELIRQAKAARPDIGAILITAFGEIELAVQAMKEGADDFLTKPITDLEQLELRVAKAVKTPGLEREDQTLKRQLDQQYGLESFTGTSPAMDGIYRMIRRVAPSNATVLVEGPSGTGKELVARAIHDLSPRAKAPFVAVECAALTSTLLESELFGYEPGAFTGANAKGRIGRFEAAHGGTLFLDEIGEIDAATQVKLLRVIESRTIQRVGGTADIPVDFRLVAATNRNLAECVARGEFREDLFYRLNVISIQMPALKDRPGDVALLTRRFLKEFSADNGGMVKDIESAALDRLAAYGWPGNVRQLRNIVERMVVLAGGEMLTVADLPSEITAPSPVIAPIGNAASIPPTVTPAETKTSLADTEKNQILAALKACNGNKSKAADMLGISRRTIHRKLNEWNLQ